MMSDGRPARSADRATVAMWVKELAEAQLDTPVRARWKFDRPKKSLAYGRKVSDGRQKIHLDVLVRPSYARDSLHLALRAAVYFPELAKIAAAMLGANAGGYGKGGMVDVAPLDVITPNPPMFLFRTADGLATLGPVIERYLPCLVAYLDERDSIGKLTAATWRSWLEGTSRAESEFPEYADRAGHWPVLVAAGQLALGDGPAALETLERCYPRGSAERAQYEQAFRCIAARRK